MLVQYLVGMCALKWDADAVDVTIGDWVADQASGTSRDVDVTVTVKAPDGLHAFKGYEVKDWSTPLDVSDVDALVLKFNDMPSVTQRAVVSTSGYTGPAIKKAEYHGVDLYEIKEWTEPLEELFPHLAPMTGPPAEVIKTSCFVLQWWVPVTRVWLGCDAPPFNIGTDGTLYDSAGKKHGIYGKFESFRDEMMTRSTGILWELEPVQSYVAPLLEAPFSTGSEIPTPQWPYAHTLDITSDEVYVLVEEKLYQVDTATIHGELRWQHRPAQYFAMTKVPSGEAFAGAVIAHSGMPGHMWAFIISGQDRTFSFKEVRLERKQLNSINMLKLAQSEDNSSRS